MGRGWLAMPATPEPLRLALLSFSQIVCHGKPKMDRKLVPGLSPQHARVVSWLKSLSRDELERVLCVRDEPWVSVLIAMQRMQLSKATDDVPGGFSQRKCNGRMTFEFRIAWQPSTHWRAHKVDLIMMYRRNRPPETPSMVTTGDPECSVCMRLE